MLNSAGNTLAQKTSVTTTAFTGGTMGAVTFSSSNTVIGATGATLTVTFTNNNAIDMDGDV